MRAFPRSAHSPRVFSLGAAAIAVVGVVGVGCNFLRGYAEGESTSLAVHLAAQPATSDVELGAARFLFDDFDSLNTDALETNALPWKLVVATMLSEHPEFVVDTPSDDDWLRALEQRYGFVRAEHVNNWPGSSQPSLTRNIGMIAGTVERSAPRVRFEVSNQGCTTCHASNLWDAQGKPTRQVWLGLGSTSIDLARYSSHVYGALQKASRDPAPVIAMLDRVYPAIDPLERKTLVDILLPALRRRIGGADAPSQPVPFDNGGPGLSNAVGHVKGHFRILDPKQASHEVAFTQVPDLMGLPFRTSLLCDGVYAPTGDQPFAPRRFDAADRVAHTVHMGDVAALFTISTLGVTPKRAHETVPALQDVMKMAAASSGPPFPGVVDDGKAQRGLKVWTQRCTLCHGERTLTERTSQLVEFPNRVSPLDEIETDRARALAVKEGVLGVLKSVPVGRAIDAAPRGGYVAPTLIGVWATAPYLHNGSVPTVWHLMHPEARPDRFEQGGHALDFDKLGIAGAVDAQGTWRYPADFSPWMTPSVVDTTTPGRTHVGHAIPFDTMSEDEKSDVLEFMKTF
jgi:mono/diheme cytochrome c family protein